MTTSVYYWPSPGFDVAFPKKSDPPLPAAGAYAEVSDYLTNEVLAGSLLTYDPSPVPSTTVPITGVASNTTGLVISVGYPTGLTETAYQSGAFTPLYADGSTINLGTGAYSLLREGGLPPTVIVTPVAPTPCPPTPTTFWTTIYDKDLRTLPNQTVSASMSNTYINFTADGQPWCFHSSAASLMIVNGQGMVATVNGNSQSGNGYAGLFVALKLYQMTGWDPAKETAVQVRFSGNVIGNAISGAQVWGNRSEQWGYGPGDEAGVVRLDTVNGRTQWAYRPGAAGGDIVYPGGVPEDYNTLVFAITQQPWDSTAEGGRSGKKNYRAGFLRRQCDPNVWPSMESMPPMGAGYARTDITLDYIKMGWYAGSASGDKTITATHIRVLQRPV